jgi:hypothetical protein
VASTKDPNRATVPTKFADTTPPLPSGDYSYILEIVMNMTGTMGKLNEAVESLKTQSKSHGEKLEKIGNDVHAAKVVVGVVGTLAAAAIAFAGWVLKAYLDYLAASPHK